ncbi:hypothetical protein RA27_07345 [Ruegeria sp. ANG-R]|uniref:hypothetical protein n=1 Tax=Ruegeria sp. ANG-R TaxID=1577903 RepID=UPI00057CDEA0|nr:hypothetical protein [Ruegeria sp. ANG-R]KIC43115.1 hypothetical protein RA27_07345 [Ruegeria sp. ANG-R]
MKTFGIVFAILILVLGTIAVSFVGYHGIQISLAVVEGAKTLEPSVYVPLVVTILSAAIGLSATLYTQSRARKREVEAAFRERKIDIYLDFLETYEHLLLASKPELDIPKVDQNDLVVSLVKVRTKAVLWGSTGVLRALNEFSKARERSALETFRVVEKIQREMRKDLGLSNFGLEQDFFSKLILSDENDFDIIRNENR